MTKRLVLVFSSVSLAAVLLLTLIALMTTLHITPVQAAPAPDRQPAPPAAPLRQTTTTPTYAVSDSVSGGIVYNWVEVSGSGAPLGLSGNNQGSAEVDIGFYFPFYDNVYRTFRVSTNGYIYFSGVADDGANIPNFIGASFPPNNFISAFGTDLYVHPAVSEIYIDQQGAQTVIEFVDVQWCCGLNDPHTFEIILYPDGRILVQYRQVRFISNRDEYVVAGIENAAGSDGVTYYRDFFAWNPLLDDGLAVLYDPGDTIFGHLILDPPAQVWWEDPGQMGSFDITLFNLSGISDSFDITYSLDVSSSVVPDVGAWPVQAPISTGAPISNLGEITFSITTTIPITADWWDMATLYITASAATSPTISNTVSITYGVAQRDLSITKTIEPDPPAAGGHFRYRVTVTNAGNRAAQARNVRVTDTLPYSATWLRFDPDDGSAGTLLLPGFIWNVGDIPPDNDETLDVYMWLPQSVPTGTVLTNTAWTGMLDSIEYGPFTNNIVTHTTAVTVPQLIFDVEKIFLGPGVIGTGQIATYTIGIANRGNVPVTNTIVTDVIPLVAVFNGSTWPTYTLLADNRTLVFTIGALLNGDWNAQIFEIGVQVPATMTIGSILTNTAQVTTTAPLTRFALAQGDSDDAVIEVIDPRGDPWVQKYPEEIAPGVPATPEPGGDFTFWINYGNAGYVTVYTVTLTDTLPVSYVVLLEAGPAGVVQPDISTPGLVTWRIADLAPDEDGWTRVRVLVDANTPAGAQLLNTAEITSAAGLNITTTNDVAVAAATLDGADVTVGKRVTPVGTLGVGDWVTYTVSFSNTGPVAAAGVRISDVLPVELIHVSWMTSGHPIELLTDAPPLLVWRALQPMQPGDSGAIVITGQLDAGATWPPQSLLTNRAGIRTTTGERPVHDPNQAEVSNVVALASPYVVKTGPTLAPIGELMSYTIEYGNGGLLDAQGVLLTDTLPVSTTYVADTSGFTATTDTTWVAWEVGALLSETTGLTFTLVVSVSPNVQPGVPLRNTVVLTSATYDGDLTDNESTWVMPVGFDLSDSYKQVNGSDGAWVGSGTPVTYTIVLTNRGPYSATSVSVWDPIPAHTAYITHSLHSASGSYGYDPAGDAITWTGTVSGYAHITVTFQVTVADAAPLPRDTVIVNTAAISDGIQSFEVSAPVTITGPNLGGSYKTANDLSPSPGERITYTIVLSNSGEADAPGATLTDALPDLYVAYDANDFWSSSGSLGSNNPVTWTGVVTRNERVTITLPVTVTAGPGNHFANTAHINDGTGVVIQRSVAVSTTRAILDTQATGKVASASQVASGERVTYTITIHNSGNGPASPAQMTDVIQGGAYIAGEITATIGVIDAASPPTVTWSGPLYPGESVVITIPVTITATPGSDVPNVAEISGGDEANFYRSTLIHVYSSPNISASTKMVNRTEALPGGTLVYTLTVDNAGELSAAFLVTDTLDDDTTFSALVGAAPPGTLVVTATDGLTWSGTVNGESQVQLSFQAAVGGSASGAVTNTAHFDDGAGNVYTRTASTRVVAPDLGAAKWVEPQGEIFAGEILTYTVVMSNSGDAPAQTRFSDEMPDHTTYVVGSAHVFPTAHAAPVYHPVTRTLTWDDDIAPGDSVTLTLQVQVAPGTVTGTVISNVAWFQELSLPGPLFSAGVSNTVRAPLLSAAKQSTPAGGVLPGKPITYSIILANEEGGVARVVMTDSIPAHTGYVGNGFGAIYDPVNDWLTWTGDVGPRSVVTLTFTVAVSPNVTVGAVITNVALVQELSQPGVILRPAVTNTVVAPDLSAFKQVEPQGEVFAGEILTYTIVMNNAGNAPAPTHFSDTLPAHTSYVSDSVQIFPATHVAPVYYSATRTLTWEDAIGPGEMVTLTFNVSVDLGTATGTVISNVAWFQELSEPGPLFSDGVSNTVRSLEFSAVKRSTPAGDVRTGEVITYSIVLTNAEGGVAQVTVTDTIPAHTSYVTMSAGTSGGGLPPVYDALNDWLTWQGEVGPYSVVTLTFAVDVAPGLQNGEVISNVAWIRESSQPAATSISVTNTVVAPVLSAAKLADPDGIVYPGAYLTYTIVMTNSGDAPAQVSFSDEMPDHTTYITASAYMSPTTPQAPTYHPVISTLTWEGDVAPDSVARLIFRVQVAPGAPDGAVISNTAWLQELSEPGPILSATVTNTVRAPVFSAVKFAAPADIAHRGEIIGYRIVLTNSTVGIARAVVTDTIPTHTTYVSGSAAIDIHSLFFNMQLPSQPVHFAVNDQILDPPIYDPVNDRLTWQGDVASNSVITISFEVTVSASVAAGTVITNMAWIDELSDPLGAQSYSVFNTVVGYEIYLPVVLRNY